MEILRFRNLRISIRFSFRVEDFRIFELGTDQKLQKIKKFQKNLFRTIFCNASNSCKTMVYAPIVALQSRLQDPIRGPKNRKIRKFPLILHWNLYVSPSIGKSMDFIGFRWISCINHGFDTVGVPSCVLSDPKHFGSVLGVIATREETSGVFILLGNGRSELT